MPRPNIAQGIAFRLGLYGLAIDNLRLRLTNRRRDADIVVYPQVDHQAVRQPRSLILRHLDCGSCNGCEIALRRSLNPVHDLAQYNVNFESSPRHAFALAMTGPFVLTNQVSAERTLMAMPIEGVVAVGDCAVDGGIFKNSIALADRSILEKATIVRISGCPPSPEDLQAGFLRLSREISSRRRDGSILERLLHWLSPNRSTG